MSNWIDFSIYALQEIVRTVFSLNIFGNITLGDFEIACLIIGMVATALVVKTGSFASFKNHDVSVNHFKKINKANDD